MSDAFEWMRDAACRDMGVDVFFPEPRPGRGNGHDEMKARARRICATCPVCQQCADYAIRGGWDDGIFGGLTPPERQTARRRAGAI